MTAGALSEFDALVAELRGGADRRLPWRRPRVDTERLAAVEQHAAGLHDTHARLADLRSQRALLDLIRFRVLGPGFAPLPITPESFESEQAYVDRELRVEAPSLTAADPYFKELPRYRVPVDGGLPVTLHSHAFAVVPVFLSEQYAYRGESSRVQAEPGDVVIDVGGCWGDTALYFASRVGPQGKVYVFEFNPDNLAVLRANLALNPELAARIEVVERALWDRPGISLPFVAAGVATTVLGDEPAGDWPRVTTTTLDEFVNERGIERVSFVKMDVEGAEPMVLGGAQRTLAEFGPKLAIAAYHRDDDLVRIPELIGASDRWLLYLDTFAPTGDETVLFATARSSST